MEKKKKILIICGCVIAALAVVYGAGCYYYSSHFMPNTSVNEKDVSNDNLPAAEKTITTPPQTFTIKERNNTTETISLSDIDYNVSVDDKKIVDLMGEQNAFSWPSYLFKKTSFNLETDSSFDTNSLETEVKNLQAMNSSAAVQPADAYIDKQNDTYVIVPEVEGTLLDEEKTIQAVENELNQDHIEIDLDAQGCYVSPAVKSDDEELNGHLRALQAVNNESFTIDLGGGASEELSGEQLADMISVDKSGTITTDDDKLNAYVQSLADKYNTFGSSRSFTTTGGSVISVGGSKDTYGFLMNKSSTAAGIKSAIESGQSQTVNAYYDVSANTRNASNGDIGNTYIEVSLSQQHLWFYQNGSLVLESNVITGNPTYHQDTPKGVFRVWAKQRNSTLKGKNRDGSAYETPVAYWMPIDWTGVGLHDAPWQPWSAYNTGLYYSRGSHGCVNLPPSVAASIFNAVALNTPVIIY